MEMSFPDSPAPPPPVVTAAVAATVSTAAPIAIPPRTFAELLDHVQGRADWSVSKRRIMACYIRKCAVFIETARARRRGHLARVTRQQITLAAVPCDVAWLNDHLDTLPASTFGLNPRSYDNCLTGLRTVLREVALIEPPCPAALRPEGPWAGLLEKIASDQYTHLGLGRFAAWCEARGIAPSAVTSATLDEFAVFVKTRLLQGDSHKMVKMVSKAWAQAAALIADWPQIALRIESRRKPYTYPLETFPEPFRNDIAALTAQLSGGTRQGPFRTTGPKKPLRQSSIDTRLYCIRQAASALVILGRDPATILGLADLVEEQAFEAILRFYWERAIAARAARGECGASVAPNPEDGVTAQTGAIAATLMMIARHYCKLDTETLKRLGRMAEDVKPPRQSGLSQKNRDRLRQFDDPAILLNLVHLPARLMKRAEKMGDTKQAARVARIAVAIDFELNIPIRVDNLAKLRLGADLRFSGDRRTRITHLVLTRTQTKNRHDVEWPIEPELSDHLMTYITKFRHHLAAPGSDYLFTSAVSKGGPITDERLGETIKEVIATEVGIVVNVHLFRSLVARLMLDHCPGALEDVRLLLGDKSMETVLAHYASREPGTAARRFAGVLRQTRRGGSTPPAKPGKGALG
jgi:integrase